MKRSLTVVGHRFFVESEIGDSTQVTLVEDEARHLATVMRGQAGDEVTLFDGSGSEYSAIIEKTAKNKVELRVVDRHHVDRELSFEVTIGVALPRGDRQKWLVEKLVELGVKRLVPLITKRGVAQPTDDACVRLRRAVIEAAKQCGRNRLMEIAMPRPVATFVSECPSTAVRLIAHPAEAGGVSISTVSLRSLASRDSDFFYAAVGPEGGFAEEEVGAAANCGWQAIDLGSRILRIETAAIAIASVLGTR